MTKCNGGQLRDYAFGELAGAERTRMERHVAECAECAAELAQLQLTTAALRALPDQEIPQRIAFVSDRVFEPSRVARFFGVAWNAGARLVFASGVLVAAAIVFAAVYTPWKPAPAVTRTVMTTVMSHEIDARINKAVSDAVARVHEEDARVMRAAVANAEKKSERERRALMVAMDEQMNTLQKRLGVLTEYAMAGPERGSGMSQ